MKSQTIEVPGSVLGKEQRANYRSRFVAVDVVSRMISWNEVADSLGGQAGAGVPVRNAMEIPGGSRT